MDKVAVGLLIEDDVWASGGPVTFTNGADVRHRVGAVRLGMQIINRIESCEHRS